MEIPPPARRDAAALATFLRGARSLRGKGTSPYPFLYRITYTHKHTSRLGWGNSTRATAPRGKTSCPLKRDFVLLPAGIRDTSAFHTTKRGVVIAPSISLPHHIHTHTHIPLGRGHQCVCDCSKRKNFLPPEAGFRGAPCRH